MNFINQLDISNLKVDVNKLVAIYCSCLLATYLCSSAVAENKTSNCVEASKKVKEGLILKDGSLSELNSYRTAIEICPEMAEAHHNLGIVLLKQGKEKEAVSSLEKALTFKPDTSTRLALASIYMQQDNPNVAKEQYQKVLDDDPNNLKALQGLGVVYEKLGELVKAAKALEQAKSIDPNATITLYNLGVINAKLSKSDDAISLFKRVSELQVGFEKVNLFLGIEFAKKQLYPEAIQELEKAVLKNPDLVDAHRALGVAHRKNGDLDKAELSLRKALSLGHHDSISRIDLATVLIEKKQEALAESELNSAIASDPNNARAYSVLGWCQIELGKYREAEQSLLKAIQIDPQYADAQNNLGVLYQRQGKNDNAARAYQEALKTNPNLPSAQNNLDRLLGK